MGHPVQQRIKSVYREGNSSKALYLDFIVTLNHVYYCLVSEVMQWMFDDLRRPPDIRIFHESSMVICSRRHCTLWGTHARRHSCWVGPGSSVIMLQISKHFVKRSYREQDKITLYHATCFTLILWRVILWWPLHTIRNKPLTFSSRCSFFHLT